MKSFRLLFSVTFVCAAAIAANGQQTSTVHLSANDPAGDTIALWSGDLSTGASRTYPAPQDLTEDGAIDAFRLSMDQSPAAVAPTIIVWSGAGDASIWEWTPYTVPSGRALLIPFSEFVPLQGWGADFTSIDRVEFEPGGFRQWPPQRIGRTAQGRRHALGR